MNEKRIAEIVRKVYAEAKKKCVSDKNNALATYVEEEIFRGHKKNISYRTIERAFAKYIDGKNLGPPIAESVHLLCKFLGYEDYSDYVSKVRKRKWVITVAVTISLVAVLLTISIFVKQPNSHVSPTNKCMAWADTLYVEVSCTNQPYSPYGTDVEPLDSIKLKNFKKVEVNAAYPFFTEDGKPLIWYYKNKDEKIEYYTAPGLHPVNGETLRKITEDIIQKYVPIHINRVDSFVQ